MAKNARKAAVLVFVPPGRRGDLHDYFSSVIGSRRVFDIESTLCKNADGRMFDVVNKNSKEGLRRLWKQTIKTIEDAIRLEPKHLSTKYHLILGNALYFKSATMEVFSAVDSTYLKSRSSLKFSHVIMAIEDIPDIYEDLTGKQEVFNDSALAQFLNERARRSSTISGSKIYIDWMNSCINTILRWRAQEIVLAENIASALDCRFLLWGLKQDPQVLLSWLKKKNSIYYLSHPISEPRGQEKDGIWPPIVPVINSIQARFLSKRLHAVIPTAIDELRFQKNAEGGFTSLLSRRWPIQDGVLKQLKPHKVIREGYEGTNLFAPYEVKVVESGDVVNLTKTPVRIEEVQQYYDGSFAAVETAVKNEIGNRDHLLVSLTEGVIVIEPWSSRDGKIHSGVGKEMLYLSTVNRILKQPDRKRICAIFSTETVAKAASTASFNSRYVSELRKVVGKKYRLKDPQASNMITDEGRLDVLRGGALGPAVSPDVAEDAQLHFEEYTSVALVNAFLSMTMEMTGSEREFIMPLCLENLQQITDDEKILLIKAYLIRKRNSDAEYSNLTGLLRESRFRQEPPAAP